MVREGRVRPLAVTTTSRSTMMPDVPTVAESGVSGYDADVWFGLIGPRGLPQPIVAKIHADTSAALGIPALRERFASQDAAIINGAPDAFAALMRDEDAKWSRVIREANIRVE
jgi:tripartite-type tricarboxylate transporter receptor subunit TctC